MWRTRKSLFSLIRKGYLKVVILEPYLRGGLTELEACQFFLVRPPKLKTWIPTDLGLKFMGFLADLKIFHFEALGVLSKSGVTSKNHDFG